MKKSGSDTRHDGDSGKAGSETRRQVVGMDKVIDLMNQLHEVSYQISANGRAQAPKITLPQILVLGSQSSGKTSVLESISGEEFLPRGTGLQTRCPIVIQLINIPQTSQKWAEIVQIPGTRFTDMSEVKAQIAIINQAIVASKQVISETPITVKLYSPHVTDLSLVDLPGLVYNLRQGDPPNLVEKIDDLVRRYISQENCIILAVSEATSDIANSRSIRFARTVDPQGRRTLGVLTKLDMMDEGTNANEVLYGKKIRLELGIIGVVNMSHKDIQDGKSFQDQLLKERTFLETCYPALASTNGTPYLIGKISKLLLKTIQVKLPAIKSSIEDAIDGHHQILKEMDDIFTQDEDKTALLLRLVTKFLEAYNGQVDGRRRNLEMTSLNASARIKNLFDQKLGKEFSQVIAANKLSDEEIDIAIYNSHALHSRHIDYDDAFQELAKREIRKLTPYVNQCAKEVCKEMKEAIDRSCESFMKQQYPKLYEKIRQAATELINDRAKDCQRYLEDYLNAEASIARTINGGFRDNNEGFKRESAVEEKISPEEKRFSSSSSSDENYTFANDASAKKVKSKPKPEVNLSSENFEDGATHRAKVRKDVQMYFDAAKRQIMEHVARGIVYKLVYGTSNRMTEFMLLRFHNTENAKQLFIDSNHEERTERRKMVEDTLAKYENANVVIDSILSTVDNL